MHQIVDPNKWRTFPPQPKCWTRRSFEHLTFARTISFSNAELSVVSRPVSPLAVLATVRYEATSGAGRKLGGKLTSFRKGTVAANSATRSNFLLALGHRCVVNGYYKMREISYALAKSPSKRVSN